jgi:hypothetical protein
MKRVAALTIGIVALASTLALAAQPMPLECTRIEGVITAVDYGAQQIVVEDTTGGATIVVQASARTRITARGEVVPFDFLDVGMRVRVCGLWDDGVLDARRIVARPSGR